MKTSLGKGLPSSLSKALFFSVFKLIGLLPKFTLLVYGPPFPSLSVVAESDYNSNSNL